MKVTDAAKAIMKTAGVTQADVAEKAGLGGQSTIATVLRSKSMRTESLLRILDVCGYELVARSVDGTGPEFIIGDEKPKAERASETLEAKIRRIVAEELEKR